MKIFKPETKLKSKILTKHEIQEFHSNYIENKSIFGIDIYRYSEYPEDAQVYVPVLFNSIYSLTVLRCLVDEAFFFSSYAKTESDFKVQFISSGDGGFQIFDNPLQSIIFGAIFELNVRRFNSGSYITTLNMNLFNIINRIELRYCITYDKIFRYDSNYFGSGIINNARILTKDNLNRLLIDVKTLGWFDHYLNTIENLTEIRQSDLIKLSFFKDYDKNAKTEIFKDGKGNHTIKSLDILKIGSIKSKNTNLDIYNLKIQLSISYEGNPHFKKEYKAFAFTIGNLNTHGIQ